MPSQLPHITARLVGTPLMVEQQRLEVVLSALRSRIGVQVDAASWDGTRAGHLAEPRGAQAGVAVIPIHGTLVKRASQVDAASGRLLSYGEIEETILDAATDPSVRAILMDIDSPGGEVGGVFDLAALIREAREAKPIWALADNAFSAAYLIASAAHRIILPQTAGVGSVGVIAAHVDQSQRDSREGFKVTTIFAGERKKDFSSHEPLSDEARRILQIETDRLYGMFVGAVAANRNMSEEAVRATEAGLFFGDSAVKAGLADQVGAMRDVLAGFSGLLESQGKRQTLIQRAAKPPESLNKETIMPQEAASADQSPAAESSEPTQGAASPASANAIDPEKLRNELMAELRQEAHAVTDLCSLAGMPALAGEFIAKGLSTEQVREQLLAKRAAASPEIHSHVLPGTGAGARAGAGKGLDPGAVYASRAQQASAGGR